MNKKRKRKLVRDKLTKISRMMKLCVFFVFVLVTNVTANTMAQRTMSISGSRMSFKEIFLEIKKQTGYTVVYNSQRLDAGRRMNVDFRETEVNQILEKVLQGTGLRYEFEDDFIILSLKESIPQQGIRISGVVRNANKEPLPGVTIRLAGTTLGTATDAEGAFVLNLPATEGTLEFSFVGYKPEKVNFNPETKTLQIVMEEEVTEMDEVVVTGYSTVRSKDYVGAATTVKMDDIEVGGITTLDQMLAGNIPGLQVTLTSGQVGVAAQVRVRGTSTLLGNQNPLWVVDGVIQRDPVSDYNNDAIFNYSTSDSDLRTYASNAIAWLNPADVETITVLKDASATAIYGSSAANGVIVVTTKKGRNSAASVNYNGELSVGMRPAYRLYDLMNSRQQMQFDYENYLDGYSYPKTPLNIGFAGILTQLYNKEITQQQFESAFHELERTNTDWFDILFRNSVSHRHTVSISGGTDKIQSRFSVGYQQTLGEAKGNDQEQFNINSGTTIHFNKGITVSANLNGTYRKANGFAYGVNPFNYAYNTSRSIACYDEDGAYVYHEKSGATSYAISGKTRYNYNIVNERNNTGSRNVNKTFGGSIDLNIPLLKGFKYKGLLSYNFSESDIKSHATERSYHISQIRGFEYGAYESNDIMMKSTRLPYGGVLNTNTQSNNNLTFRNDFVYDNQIEDVHRITLQAGLELRSNKSTGLLSTNYGYLRDRGETFAEVPITHYQYGNSSKVEENYLTDEQRQARRVLNTTSNYMSGYFLGVYSYRNRYVINASARVDASNRFGQDKNKKWQPTWSIAGRWRVDQEAFMREQNGVNTLDVSVSYGYQGNAVESVSPYLIAGISTYNYDFQQFGMSIKSLPYPDLGWEKTHTFNAEINLGFLNNRLNVILDYYNKVSDILASRDVPFELGINQTYVDGTKMKNKGYELHINTVPVRTKDWNWQVTFNLSKNVSKISDSQRVNTLNDFLNGTAIFNGNSHTTFYSYKFKGLSEEDGTPLFDLGKKEDGEDWDGFVDRDKMMEPEEAYKFLVKTGKTTPDLDGGFSTRIKYKRLTLNAQFNFRFGASGRLPGLYPSSLYGCPFPEGNYSTKLLNRWRAPEDDTQIPSVPGIGRYDLYYIPCGNNYEVNPYDLYNYSDVRVAKTDMIRCTQLSLTFDFNNVAFLKRLGCRSLSLRGGVTNPFFIAFDKAWGGLDPETGNWPARRMVTFSMNLSF